MRPSTRVWARRLSGGPLMQAIDYADFMFGVGAPSGAYGRSGDALLIYWRLDAPTTSQALYLSVDGGSTWGAQGGGGGGIPSSRTIATTSPLTGGGDLSADRTLGITVGSSGGVQAWNADLDGYAALSTTGLVARTGSGTAETRSIAAGSEQITVSNADGVSGNPTVDLAYAMRIQESAGPTTLTVGAVANGQVLKRVGNTLVGAFVAVAVSIGPLNGEALGERVIVLDGMLASPTTNPSIVLDGTPIRVTAGAPI